MGHADSPIASTPADAAANANLVANGNTAVNTSANGIGGGEPPPSASPPAAPLLLDAGLTSLHFRRGTERGAGEPPEAWLAAAACGGPEPWLTGQLAGRWQERLGRGRVVTPATALWAALAEQARAESRPLAALDLSASGFLLIGVDATGALADDLLVSHPRCGAGTGLNLERVLQKLGLSPGEVDGLLAKLLDAAGADARRELPARLDRCGVFSASATVSDKNQGIPVDRALATAIKSEVEKVCARIPPGFGRVLLTGGVFRWRFAQDCARDFLGPRGDPAITVLPPATLNLAGLDRLARQGSAPVAVTGPSPAARLPPGSLRAALATPAASPAPQPVPRTTGKPAAPFPQVSGVPTAAQPFPELLASLSAAHRFRRLTEPGLPALDSAAQPWGQQGPQREPDPAPRSRPDPQPHHGPAWGLSAGFTADRARGAFLGLDVGSTLAKAVLADADGTPRHWLMQSNAGDTLEVLKALLTELQALTGPELPLAGIGITGSARRQVRATLEHVYPALSRRITVLVENHAHALGGVVVARAHRDWLVARGITTVDARRAVLVDVGGEDTKLSVIDLASGALVDNVMNTKCSAGTGSVMDALAGHLAVQPVASAYGAAAAAGRVHAMDATCAVFVMESAQRLRAAGIPPGEILASAVWAVAENMARGLWRRLSLPGHAVVLLQGQTMASDPLALASVARLSALTATPMYGVVPPRPGHRACLGLIEAMRRSRAQSDGHRHNPVQVQIPQLRDPIQAGAQDRTLSQDESGHTSPAPGWSGALGRHDGPGEFVGPALPHGEHARASERAGEPVLVPTPVPGQRSSQRSDPDADPAPDSDPPPAPDPVPDTARLPGSVPVRWADFLDQRFRKQVFVCRGAACSDPAAACYRVRVTGEPVRGAIPGPIVGPGPGTESASDTHTGAEDRRKRRATGRLRLSLGGCSAVNERGGARPLRDGALGTTAGRDASGVAGGEPGAKPGPLRRDAYQEAWQLASHPLPRSQDPSRLVIPRSFAVSEWSLLLARFLESLGDALGHPVHVDDVEPGDLARAQARFRVDTCAPLMGAVGQMLRLAESPHRAILALQLEYLPVDGPDRNPQAAGTGAAQGPNGHAAKGLAPNGLGRTCTVNQGGPAAARGIALAAQPTARIPLLRVSIRDLTPEALGPALAEAFTPLFRELGIRPAPERIQAAAEAALAENLCQRRRLQDFLADRLDEALAQGRPVAWIVGREYLLHPGVFDSHVGRLCRDQGLVALPAAWLGVTPDPEFRHLYWRNSQTITTTLAHLARGTLHQRIDHFRLRERVERLERSGHPSAPIQVSTFRCGPDSVTAALHARLLGRRPFLVIESDAVLQELAHLESRVATLAQQLSNGPTQDGRWQARPTPTQPGPIPPGFAVADLDRLVNTEALDPTRDRIVFPTLGDNRAITSVIRAAGFKVATNYHPDRDNLAQRIARGRQAVGDQVCAPLAAVYGDTLEAMDQFRADRAGGQETAERLCVFDNKSSGPCRQGQYAELHKLAAHQQLCQAGCPSGDQLADGSAFRFLVADERQGYNIGLPEWALLRAFEGTILHGLLQALRLDGARVALDRDRWTAYEADWRTLKDELYALQEHALKPGPRAEALARRVGPTPYLGPLVKFFAYGLHHSPLAKALARFRKRWPRLPAPTGGRIRIYLEGEAYLRGAQAEAIYLAVLDILGPNRFEMQASPVWSYMDYMLAEERRSASARRALQPADRELRSRLHKLRALQTLYRRALGRPLYRAAGIPMPDPMEQVLDAAANIVPTLRPNGELMPYLGEALLKQREGFDVYFNVAPEGCMVASMGEVLTPWVETAAGGPGSACSAEACAGPSPPNGGRAAGRPTSHAGTRIEPLFTADGTVDIQRLTTALLKALGPERLAGVA